ncbi:MAG TPA: cysteine desulfurase [Gammaproteobacteria bacterium]|nr:cysteine desulfurase [Gammaproteobacteria bacterium]
MMYKNDFPILHQKIHGKPLVFLDSAASSQKPQCVIDSLVHYYEHDHANIHRGVYELSERATKAYENARVKIQHFIHAEHAHEIIFVRSATEAINLVAQSYGRTQFQKNDEIILSEMEHHSNIVPWQLLAEQCGIVLRVIPVLDNGELDLDAYQTLFSPKTKMVAVTHASNVLGTINPIREMTKIAHQHHVPILVDGAQAIPHISVNVRDLDCDFYVFSSHKAYGPTGVGVLYGKTDLLEQMPPYQGGGSMIERVTFEKTTYAKLPYKFEAGTPNIADTIAFAAAIDYLEKIGMTDIFEHEKNLVTYATEKLSAIPGLKIIGTSKNKVGVISFILDDIHPHDIGTVLDHEGIAVRAGHHCAQPLMDRYNIPACVRASFGLYNSKEDVDALVSGLHDVKRLFHT